MLAIVKTNSVAEAPIMTTSSMISVAENILEIDRFDYTENNLNKVKKYLKDDKPVIRIIALEKLLSIPKGISSEELSEIEKKDPVWHVKRVAHFGQIKLNLSQKNKINRKEIYINTLKEEPDLLEYIINTMLEEELIKNIEDIKNQVPRISAYLKNKKERYSIKRQIKSLSRKDRILMLMNWKSVVEQEESIQALIEMGNEIVPDVLMLLQIKDNIPSTSPPPWNRKQTNFVAILKVLKSIPDKRSIRVLKELSGSDVVFVSQNLEEALQWINSGIPYPYKYERKILTSYDEITRE
jgi:hypothetical protein